VSEATATTNGQSEGPELATVPSRRRISLGWGGRIAAGWLITLTVAAVAAPVLPLSDPTRGDFSRVAEPPSWASWLGTDELGRDVLARVVWGGRVTLLVAVCSILIGVVVGGALGVVAGYSRRWVDGLVVWMVDVMLAFPSLVLAIAIATFLGPGQIRNVILAVAVFTIPAFTRIGRAASLSVSRRDHVLAARSIGASTVSVVGREVLPLAAISLVTYSLLGLSGAVGAESALSFLGLSVSAPTPTWGSMVASGRAHLANAPHIPVVPSAVIVLTVLAFNVVGDRLRRSFDVRESQL